MILNRTVEGVSSNFSLMVDTELLSWIKRSKQRQEILLFLEEPRTPTEVSDEVGTQISQVSHSLSEMREKDLVKVLNPDAKTGRLYELNENGRKLLNTIS